MFFRCFLCVALCVLVAAASAQVDLWRLAEEPHSFAAPDSVPSDSLQIEVLPVEPAVPDSVPSDSLQIEVLPVEPAAPDSVLSDSLQIDVPDIDDPSEPGSEVVDQPTDFDVMVAQLDSLSIPLVNITVTEADLNPDEYIPAEIEIADFFRRTQKDSMVFVSKCKVRYRGSSSLSYKKKSFAVKLLDDEGQSRDEKILGIRKDNNWILNAQAVDRLRMRNKICFDVWNSYSRTPYKTDYDDRNGIVCHSVEVFLNGRYHGLYSLSDKIDRKLLALKKTKEVVQQITYPDSLGGSRDTTVVAVRGLLFKCVKMGWGGTLMWNNTEGIPPMDTVVWNSFELKHPEEYPCADAWMPLYDLIQLYHSSTTRYKYYQFFDDYYYRQNTIDYMILLTLFRITDNAMKNTYLSVVDVEKAHQFLITPWDMDASMSGTWNGDYDNTLASFANVATWCAPFNRMYLDANYRADLDARLAEVFPSSFALDSVRNRMMNEADLLMRSGAWQRERNRWNGILPYLKLNLKDEVELVLDWYRSNLISLGLMSDELEPEPELPTKVSLKTTDSHPGTIRSLAGYVVASPSVRGVYVRDGKLIRIK